MKKALIICAGGMSSSMIAMKTQELLQKQGYDVVMDARGTQGGKLEIENKTFDLYLISPQTKMYFKMLKETADANGMKIAQIPPQAYIPVQVGIEKMAALVKAELNL